MTQAEMMATLADVRLAAELMCGQARVRSVTEQDPAQLAAWETMQQAGETVLWVLNRFGHVDRDRPVSGLVARVMEQIAVAVAGLEREQAQAELTREEWRERAMALKEAR